MRIAILAESFLPEINGVTTSVLRVTAGLAARRHDVLVVAPGHGPVRHAGAQVVRVRALRLPAYRSVPVALPTRQVEACLEGFRPDVVHLAGPLVLGAQGAAVAARLQIPAVAVYQTDWPGFARHYGLAGAQPLAWAWVERIHRRADRTLAPSWPSVWALRRRGVPRVHRWSRGVDAEQFHPRHRDDRLRRRLAPRGEVIVGFVGRLAREKRVHLLEVLRDLPGVRVVVVGDGPERQRLERLLPFATFLGLATGDRLAQAYASFDVFVHPGAADTFCQAVQEAMAAGVPVAAAAAGGPLDLVRHGRTGLLWAADDPQALRAAVAELAGDGQRRAAMGAAARRLAEPCTWDARVLELIDHYRAVLEHAGREVAA
ncbi:MAG: glycosyltransferase [Euzebyales bacterium]|nr:glycosyltransferase [Euzebyales bacterium]